MRSWCLFETLLVIVSVPKHNMSLRNALQLCLRKLKGKKVFCPLSNILGAVLLQQRSTVLLHFLPADKFTSQTICPDLIKCLVILQVREDQQHRSPWTGCLENFYQQVHKAVKCNCYQESAPSHFFSARLVGFSWVLLATDKPNLATHYKPPFGSHRNIFQTGFVWYLQEISVQFM